MKTNTVLRLYDALLCGEKVSRATFCTQHNICERTFYRYIKDIGEFLMRYKSNYVIAVDIEVDLEFRDCRYYFVEV